ALLSAANGVAPTFRADLAGSYVATLVVNDGRLSSAAATVSITATVGNAAPVANAGALQNVTTGSVVTLSGAASSDANGDALGYSWTMTSRPTGSSAALANATTVAPSFTADVAGSYVVALVVSDGQASSSTSSVTVKATTPQANLPVEQLMTTAAFGDVEFDWGRDGVDCASCNGGAGNARFNWVDRTNRLWVANIDPVTGAITPQNGRGVLVDSNAVYYTEYGNGPEWVFSQLGSQLVYTRYDPAWIPTGTPADDDHVGIGLAQMSGGSWTSGFLDGQLQRNSPAPTQSVTDAVPYMAFASSTSLSFFWRKLGSPPGPEVNTRVTTIGLAVRWVPGTQSFVFTNGADPVDGVTYQQVYFYDTAVGGQPQQLTTDSTQKRGAFMFSAPEFGGDMVFVTVADRTQLRIYRYMLDSGGVRRWTLVNTILSPSATEPYIATPEPFTYNGKTWLFVTLSRSKAASDITVSTNLALTGIDPATPNMRMLTDDSSPSRLRQDPEYFITSQGAYVYYSRAFPATDTSGTVHDGYFRVDTGLGAPQAAATKARGAAR
ncbi:MAG: PKD domain-containing protein, partial [Rubrivivax sp.]